MPKLNLKVSNISVLSFEITSENEKFNGPIGVKKSTARPTEDLTLPSPARVEL